VVQRRLQALREVAGGAGRLPQEVHEEAQRQRQVAEAHRIAPRRLRRRELHVGELLDEQVELVEHRVTLHLRTPVHSDSE
jgi:hypothetical protein